MKRLNLEYIARTMGNLSGIPIRLFCKGKQTFYYSTVHLPKDPIDLYLGDILLINEQVGYFVTNEFSYYGIVNSKNVKMVIGPSGQTTLNESDIKKLSFLLGVKQEEEQEFMLAMKSIVPMPLDSIMQMLCVVNHVMNGAEAELKDVTIVDNKQAELTREITVANFNESDELTTNDIHNTFFIEQTIENMISNGDVDGFKAWAAQAQAVRGGTVAFDQIRQLKNTFIVTATLASRAAIRGGLDVEEALSLSDMYIKRCELMCAIGDITNLQYHMILDFIGKVERLHLGKEPSELTIAVSNYIHQHITACLTTEMIAEKLSVSRTHLSRKFHENTGKTLVSFIQEEKMREAKRLLRYTAKSLVDISNYLSFSSPCYFSKVFKKSEGITPKEYRDKSFKA